MSLAPLSILQSTFGYDSFRDQQEEIIEHVLAQKDGLVLMPTGGGKSLCYQIPALVFDGLTLVVSPLISLMKDQVQALQANGVKANYINSSNTTKQDEEILKQASEGQLKLLYLSPEKLITLSNTWIELLPISLVAIDEAHCISMWGHDFRPEYTQLADFRNKLSEVPFIALTATADKTTRKDIVEQLALKNSQTFISSFNRQNLSLRVKPQVPKKDKIKQMVSFINNRPNESGIIYCLSRKNTEDLVEDLLNHGINASFYHAGMSPSKREEVQEKFILDDIKIMVATIAFGMGIDKSNVRWVIHNNLPKNIEGYYQEIGRAGRDGLESDTVLYFNYKDVILLKKFADQSGQTGIQHEKLKRMQQFAEATSCRRKILLAYFGEHLPEDCGNCDICNDPPEFFDGTLIAQKGLSALARLKENVGINMLINVLRGSRNAEIQAMGYYKIKTYGAGSEFSFFDWQHYLIQLLNIGATEIDYQNGNKLRITDFGWDILKSNQKIKLTRPVKLVVKKKAKKEIKEFSPNKELFENLKKLRLKISREENVPPYIIFNDKSLQEMSSEMPINDNQFLAISGVGQQKLESFGEEFLNAIAKFKKENQPVSKKSTISETYELYQEGFSPEEIADKRNLQITTIYSHIATLFEDEKINDLANLVTSNEINRVKEAIGNLEKEVKLKPIFEALNEEIPYYKIRLALSSLKRSK
jgi:ATP-dependent DNA helicase RecQ